jgi:outer membrane lipoprotein SlyB
VWTKALGAATLASMVDTNKEIKAVPGIGGAAIGALVGSIAGPLGTIAGAVAGGVLGPKYLTGVAEKVTDKINDFQGNR